MSIHAADVIDGRHASATRMRAARHSAFDPLMRVTTLGTTAIIIGNHTVGVEQPRTFVCLFLLACASPRALSRTQLGAQLWPSSEARERNHRLRTLLYRIRQLEAPLVCDEVTVTLAERPAIDFRDYSTLPSSLADVERRLPVAGSVLPGLDASRVMGFGDELEHVRDTIVATMSRWLESALLLAKSAGEWDLVAALAETARAVDADNEAAWLSLAEA